MNNVAAEYNQIGFKLPTRARMAPKELETVCAALAMIYFKAM